MKFENVDIIDSLRQIMEIHTQHYKEDFELDEKLIQILADSSAAEDKHFLWMSRPNGTHILREREVYVEGSPDNRVWNFYHEQTNDPILAYAVTITDTEDGVIKGDLIELDYAAHVERSKLLTVSVDRLEVQFADDGTYFVPFKSSRRDIAKLEERHGKAISICYLPENKYELDMILRRERAKLNFRANTGNIQAHISAIAKEHQSQKLESEEAMLPPMAQPIYEAYLSVKDQHPKEMVCFEYNGYFELYGEDAIKAAPMLGAKLLHRPVDGTSIPVTGFKEAAWVAGSYKLWKHGEDVFLSKDGKTFKELKAADFIPVGAKLTVDNKPCRIESVDFAADKVVLTNLENRNKPTRIIESVAYIRSYVEDAGIAIYNTVPSKKEETKSIRQKLKSPQNGKNNRSEKPQIKKGKDMEI